MILYFRARASSLQVIVALTRISYLCRRRWQECNGKWKMVLPSLAQHNWRAFHNSYAASVELYRMKMRCDALFQFFISCVRERISESGGPSTSEPCFFGQSFECETCCSLFAHHASLCQSLPTPKPIRNATKKLTYFPRHRRLNDRLLATSVCHSSVVTSPKKVVFRSENVAPASEP